MKRGGPLRRRKRLRSVSERRREENDLRRQQLPDAYGRFPDCRGYNILPPCFTLRPHQADDGHETLTRARGGSITDPANVIPLCRDGHDWVTTHPAEAALLRTRDDRPFLTSGYA